MAHMHPAKISGETVSSAERTLFRELRAQLSDEFTVLHSVHWLSHERGRAHDGEANFVIAHPDLGVLVLEVKGGTIRRDGVTNAWTSEDMGGTIHDIHDPFEQAERSMHMLADKLKSSPTTCGFTYPYCRSVAFPDVILPAGDLGPNIQREIIIDSSNLFLLVGAIRKAMAVRGMQGPGRDGVKALVELLRPSFELSRLGLAAQIKADESALNQLTEQQLLILDVLAGHRRIAIQGTAGSGKTILAMEQVRRLANQGFQVLFTCYNKALAGVVREQLAGELGDAMDRVVVRNYHELARELAIRAGTDIPSESVVNASPTAAAFYEEDLPMLMLEALETVPDRFDAIVVDEGQDFADLWWMTLEELFVNRADGILAIFYDDNQRLYGRASAYPITEPHYSLTKNCRCTQRIHQAAAMYCISPMTTDCKGPDGRDPEMMAVDSGTAVATLKKVIHRLVSEEGIPLSEIVVLTPRGPKTSELAEGMKIGNGMLTWGDGMAKDVRCRSIHGFKGLESSVVVLVECARAHEGTRNVLMHVALTRARHHVVVIGALPEPAPVTEGSAAAA